MTDGADTFAADDPGRPHAWATPREWWRDADDDLRVIVVVVGLDVLAVVVMLTTFLVTFVPHLG